MRRRSKRSSNSRRRWLAAGSEFGRTGPATSHSPQLRRAVTPCAECAGCESLGHCRCYVCGAPLNPPQAAVEQARAIYKFTRNLSLPGLGLRYATPLGGVYGTSGLPNCMPRIMVFMGADWLALNYDSRSLNLAFYQTTSQGWQEELDWWQSLRPDQPIALTAENHRRSRVCFLARLDERTNAFTLRSFRPGDWCGLVDPVLVRTNESTRL